MSSFCQENLKKKYINTNSKAFVIVAVGLFIFFVIFFSRIHPITLFDTDDWNYSFQSRIALPQWGYWNPTRVLPEILMPIASSIGIYIIYPVIGNFLQSLTLSYAITVSLFVVLYFLSFMRLLKKRTTFNNSTIIISTIYFLMLHFLIFRSEVSNNLYMFGALDACCYFFYLIPSLLNCSIVMYLVSANPIKTIKPRSSNAFFVLIIYLALLSNLFNSIIFVAYIFGTLLVEYLSNYIRKTSVTRFIKEKISYFTILFAWLVIQIFEMSGGRASSLSQKAPYFDRIKQTLSAMKSSFVSMNPLFVILAIAATIIGIMYLIKTKKIKSATFMKLFITAMLTCAYLIIVCSATFPAYISRPDVIFPVTFLIFSAMSAMFGYIIQKYDRLMSVSYILMLIIYSQIYTSGMTFVESNVLRANNNSCSSITQGIIDSIVEADKNNQDEVEISVPKFNSQDNWPIANYSGDAYSSALYKYGITKRKMSVKLVFSEEMREKVLETK